MSLTFVKNWEKYACQLYVGTTLPWCHEVHRAGLLRIVRIKHLCHVKTVVGREIGVVLGGRFNAGGGG